MYIITGYRGSGKTLFLIDYAYKSGCAIITPNNGMQKLVMEMCAQMKKVVPVYSIEEILQHKTAGKNTSFVIDELEMLLHAILPNCKIELATTGQNHFWLGKGVSDQTMYPLRGDELLRFNEETVKKFYYQSLADKYAIPLKMVISLANDICSKMGFDLIDGCKMYSEAYHWNKRVGE